MATKGKKPAAKKADANVVRITAASDKKASVKPAAEKTAAAVKKTAPKKKAATQKTTPNAAPTTKKKNIFRSLGEYFAGAWYELRQVNWPTRKATWSMTGAMLAFTGIFAAVILLLDFLFKYLFELMLG